MLIQVFMLGFTYSHLYDASCSHVRDVLTCCVLAQMERVSALTLQDCCGSIARPQIRAKHGTRQLALQGCRQGPGTLTQTRRSAAVYHQARGAFRPCTTSPVFTVPNQRGCWVHGGGLSGIA